MRNNAYWVETPANPFKRTRLPKKKNTVNKDNFTSNKENIRVRYCVIWLEFSPTRSNRKSVMGATATTDNAFNKACKKTNPKSNIKCHGKCRKSSVNNFTTILILFKIRTSLDA